MTVELEAIRKETWLKGRIIDGMDPSVFRKDDYGDWLKYDEFLKEKVMGWDLERRYDPDSCSSEYFPVSRNRMKKIYQEVERTISQVIEDRGAGKA